VRQLHFIVNPSSGGGRGGQLAHGLTAVVGQAAVSILGRCELSAIIARMKSDDAIIACGGDGTASAVAGILAAQKEGPALGVVPLGTGNDLARTLGWASFPQHDVSALVATLRAASYRYHDCWRLDGPSGSRVWCNYLSVGIDAQVALNFHHLRLRHPWLARGGMVNRGLYGLLGAQQRGLALAHVVRVSDELRLPRSASVMVLSNITSYAGGATLARDIRMDDRQFEVVALGHGLRLGLATGGLRRPRLVSRRDQLSFNLGCDLAMQTDGEAFTALPGRYDVTHTGTIKTLVAARPRS
jgi:diacylglycerol kinase (ATP)